MVKVNWEKVVEYDMPETLFTDADTWEKSIKTRLKVLPAQAGSRWRGVLDGSNRKETASLRPALISRIANKDNTDPKSLYGGGKKMAPIIGEYKVTLVSEESIAKQMNAYYELLDVLNTDKQVTSFNPLATITQEPGDVADAVERAIHYVLYSRQKTTPVKKIVGVGMGFISPRYTHLKKEMKLIPGMLSKRYGEILKELDGVEGNKLIAYITNKYPDIQKYESKGPQKLESPFEFYLVGNNLPITHFGYVIDDEPYELDMGSCIKLIRHDKNAYDRLHQLKPGGTLHPPDEGGKYYFTISNDPLMNITKSTSRYWEQGSCERAWCVGGSAHQGVYDDIKQGNLNLFVCSGHEPPKGWPDNQNINAPSNPPKPGEVLGRLTLRWAWKGGDKNNGVGLGPDSSFYGLRGNNNLKGVQNNLIMALMQIADNYGLANYDSLGFSGPDINGVAYGYSGSADAGNMSNNRLTYAGKGKLKEGVAINFDLAAANAPDIQYGALNRVSRKHIDIEVRRALARNTSIWAVKGGEACIARLIESNDQEIHRLIAGNSIAHSEAIYAVAQTMYQVFPDLEGAWMDDNTIDNVILNNPKCNQETRDYIQKTHKGYKRSSGRAWDEKKKVLVTTYAKITPFEIITFGLGSRGLANELNTLRGGGVPLAHYTPNPFILASLTSRKIGHILSKLNVVKREHPIVVGYSTKQTTLSMETGKEPEVLIETIDSFGDSVLYGYLAAGGTRLPTNKLELQMYYEYIILMHLLYCPHLTNKQFCTILLKIQEMFKTCHVNVKRAGNPSQGVNNLPFTLLTIALEVYITPRYSIDDWGLTYAPRGQYFMNQANKVKNGTSLYSSSTSAAFTKKTQPNVMKHWNQTFANAPKFTSIDGTVLLEEDRQSPESAKLIFALMRYMSRDTDWLAASTISASASLVEFLISLTRSQEVYATLWRARKKLNISPKLFTYNTLTSKWVPGEDASTENGGVVRHYDDKILLEAFEAGGGMSNHRWLKHAWSGDIKQMHKMKTRMKSTIPDSIYDSMYNNEEYFIKYGIDELNLNTENELQNYCDKVLSLSLGKLYTESDATVDDTSKLNTAKNVMELYKATEYIHLLTYAGLRLSKVPNLPIKYQRMILEGWQSISDKYGGDYEAAISTLESQLVKYNEELSPEIIIKLYNRGYEKTAIALNPNTPIEILTELFEIMPSTVLNNAQLPMNIYTKLFNLTLSILRSPIGEDKNRLLHTFKNATIKNQLGNLKTGINTLEKILRADRKSANRRADLRRFIEAHPYIQYWRGGSNKGGVFKTVSNQNLYTEGILDYIIMPTYSEFWLIQMADEHDPENGKGTITQYIHSIKKLDDGKFEITRDIQSNLPLVVSNKSSMYEWYNEQLRANPNFVCSSIANETLILDDLSEFFGWIPEDKRDKRFKEAPKWSHDNIFMFEDSEYKELENQKVYPDWRYRWNKNQMQALVNTFVKRNSGKEILKLMNSWRVPYQIRGKPPAGKTSGPILTSITQQLISNALTQTGLWTPQFINAFLPSLQQLFIASKASGMRSWINTINTKMGPNSFFENGLFTEDLAQVLLCKTQKELNDMGLPMIQIGALDIICYDLISHLWQTGLPGEFICKLEIALDEGAEREVSGYKGYCVNQINAIVAAWVAHPENAVYEKPYKDYLKCKGKK